MPQDRGQSHTQASEIFPKGMGSPKEPPSRGWALSFHVHGTVVAAAPRMTWGPRQRWDGTVWLGPAADLESGIPLQMRRGGSEGHIPLGLWTRHRAFHTVWLGLQTNRKSKAGPGGESRTGPLGDTGSTGKVLGGGRHPIPGASLSPWEHGHREAAMGFPIREPWEDLNSGIRTWTPTLPVLRAYRSQCLLSGHYMLVSRSWWSSRAIAKCSLNALDLL